MQLRKAHRRELATWCTTYCCKVWSLSNQTISTVDHGICLFSGGNFQHWSSPFAFRTFPKLYLNFPELSRSSKPHFGSQSTGGKFHEALTHTSIANHQAESFTLSLSRFLPLYWWENAQRFVRTYFICIHLKIVSWRFLLNHQNKYRFVPTTEKKSSWNISQVNAIKLTSEIFVLNGGIIFSNLFSVHSIFFLSKTFSEH